MLLNAASVANEVESASLPDNKSALSKEISPFDECKDIISPIPNLDIQTNSPITMGIQATAGLEEVNTQSFASTTYQLDTASVVTQEIENMKA